MYFMFLSGFNFVSHIGLFNVLIYHVFYIFCTFARCRISLIQRLIQLFDLLRDLLFLHVCFLRFVLSSSGAAQPVPLYTDEASEWTQRGAARGAGRLWGANGVQNAHKTCHLLRHVARYGARQDDFREINESGDLGKYSYSFLGFLELIEYILRFRTNS